jgi:hypothetical protein
VNYVDREGVVLRQPLDAAALLDTVGPLLPDYQQGM